MKWIMDIFEDLHGWNRVRVKKWQQVLGELQFMGPVILGLAGLFSALQLGLSHSDKHWVKITRFLCNHLTDFKALARNISLQPTHLVEVVLDYPLVIGSVDATKPGMGGHPLCSQTPSHSLACHLSSQDPATHHLSQQPFQGPHQQQPGAGRHPCPSGCGCLPL